jgi:hypothetical protein
MRYDCGEEEKEFLTDGKKANEANSNPWKHLSQPFKDL